MNSPIIVGLMGYKGAGKTTAGAFLYRRGFTRERFAGPLKQMLRVLGLTESQVDGDAKEVPLDLLCGKTPRHAMQTLGTEWRNMIGTDLWTNIWSNRVRGYLEINPTARIVADDLRFEHEAKAVLAVGGLLMEVVRPGCERTSDHASEDYKSWLLRYSYATIYNDTTIEEFERRLGQIFGYENEKV